MTSRIRTISQAAVELKEVDPNTCIGEHFIRNLVRNRRIPTITTGLSGTRVLINLDHLIEYLESDQLYDQPQSSPPATQLVQIGTSKIRKFV